jgi:hypothetical protein
MDTSGRAGVVSPCPGQLAERKALKGSSVSVRMKSSEHRAAWERLLESYSARGLSWTEASERIGRAFGICGRTVRRLLDSAQTDGFVAVRRSEIESVRNSANAIGDQMSGRKSWRVRQHATTS